jgi:Holliday junction DNA helicase RuvB
MLMKRVDDRDITTPEKSEEDSGFEFTLRPQSFEEFVGQDKIKSNLGVFIQAALKREESLDHVLFYGPPGLGKTTLAHIISSELNVGIKPTSGPVIERAGDLAAILTNLSDSDVLFIDEIHRLPRVVEEILYPAMEDYKLDLIIGQGPNARTLKINLPRFTLVGATTRTGLLTSPLRERFGVINRLDFYPPEDLEHIVMRSASLMGIEIQEDAASLIASRSRGTPRIVNRLLRRIRDFAEVRGDGTIDIAISNEALDALEVDSMGLDEMDRKLLATLIENFGGRPVGIETLSASLREDKDTIEDVYEPYLLRVGMIERTQRGRLATRTAYEHLGLKVPKALF